MSTVLEEAHVVSSGVRLSATTEICLTRRNSVFCEQCPFLPLISLALAVHQVQCLSVPTFPSLMAMPWNATF